SVFCLIVSNEFLDFGIRVGRGEMVGVIVAVGGLASHLDQRRAVPTFAADEWTFDAKLFGLKKNQRRLGIVSGQENHLRIGHLDSSQLGPKVGVAAAV